MAVYAGLRSLEWNRYLRAMWIICGELQSLYAAQLADYDRSLEGEALDLVRQVALLEGLPADGAENAAAL